MPAYIIMGVPVLSFFHIEEGRTTIFGNAKNYFTNDNYRKS